MFTDKGFKLLQKAVEKQIPMRVYVKMKRSWKFHCPLCTLNNPYYKSRLHYNQPYCSNCGQKIDWDGVNV